MFTALLSLGAQSYFSSFGGDLLLSGPFLPQRESYVLSSTFFLDVGPDGRLPHSSSWVTTLDFFTLSLLVSTCRLSITFDQSRFLPLRPGLTALGVKNFFPCL